jgi:hypothetical protein
MYRRIFNSEEEADDSFLSAMFGNNSSVSKDDFMELLTKRNSRFLEGHTMRQKIYNLKFPKKD